MNLYFMRHGIALAADDPGFTQDSARPLSAKGIKRTRRAARGLQRLNIPFDGILTSPLLRARQTAEIVAAALGLEARLEEISGLVPESTVDQLLFGLTRYREREHLLLMGHEPLLSGTIAHLLCGDTQSGFEVVMGKASLCRIEVDAIAPPHGARLHWFLTAKQLRLLAKH